MYTRNMFWTDSNGLEMQERQKSWRSWGYNTTFSTDEIESANFYPINSAIFLQDPRTSMQLTVMNDRSQGGTSLNDGEIKLMQNRRLLHDDSRGVGEALNETTDLGVGIEVNAVYHLQFFNYTTTGSAQRPTQLTVDEPMRFFVASSLKDELSINTSNGVVQVPEFAGDLKIHTIPFAEKTILVRLENIADSQNNNNDDAPQFDLKGYLSQLWKANNVEDEPQYEIVERSLTNNQNYADMI